MNLHSLLAILQEINQNKLANPMLKVCSIIRYFAQISSELYYHIIALARSMITDSRDKTIADGRKVNLTF
jgi:hypothetical protein